MLSPSIARPWRVAVETAGRSKRFRGSRSDFVCAGGLGGDLDLDRHASEVAGRAVVAAARAASPAGGAGDGDADQVAVADDAVGRVELDPAGAGQVDLRPGVGRAAAERRPGRRGRGRRRSRRRSGRRSRASATPRSSAARSRGRCRGAAPASPPAAGCRARAGAHRRSSRGSRSRASSAAGRSRSGGRCAGTAGPSGDRVVGLLHRDRSARGRRPPRRG